MKTDKLREKIQKELHRNSDDLYWNTISELLEIVEEQQDKIKFFEAALEDIEDVK